MSLLPSDLGATNSIIDLALELLEEIQEGELGTSIPNLVSSLTATCRQYKFSCCVLSREVVLFRRFIMYWATNFGDREL